MEKGKFYVGLDTKTKPATFKTRKCQTKGNGCFPTHEDLGDIVFYGDSGLGAALFGWGIMRAFLDMGQSIMMLFNDQDEIKFPETTVIRWY